jgi:hypothetical protein
MTNCTDRGIRKSRVIRRDDGDQKDEVTMTRNLAGWTLLVGLCLGGPCAAQERVTPAPAHFGGAGGCGQCGCGESKNFCAKLWVWATYRALPESAASIRCCNRVPTCSPPVWAFFARDIEPPDIPHGALSVRPPSVAAQTNDNLEQELNVSGGSGAPSPGYR